MVLKMKNDVKQNMSVFLRGSNEGLKMKHDILQNM